MLNRIFVIRYQLDGNTGCTVKFVINTNSQPERLSSKRAAILLVLSSPLGLPMMPG